MSQNILINSRVADDGVLRLEVPLGLEKANLEVKVTIEPLVQMSREEWGRGVLALAGTWEGPFPQD